MSVPAPLGERLYFEDFGVGDALPEVERAVEAADATWFAAELVPPLGDATPADAGRTRVSEWYAAVLGMRLLCASLLDRAASLGAPGLDDVAWTAPLYVGDVVRFAGEVTSARPSRSRADMGLVGVRFSLSVPGGARVMTQANTLLMRRRAVRP